MTATAVVSPEKISRDLQTLWAQLAQDQAETGGVLKACAMTLVVVASSDEDSDRVRQTFLRGLTADGALYDFAANNRTGLIPGTAVLQSWDEFTGATFSADGEWLFVNIQTPGISFAITGPFDRGPLGGSRGRKTSQRRDA